MTSHSLRETAAVALSLLDLTNLKDDCTPAQIETLCARAQSPYGNTAAVCIWPRFVAQARGILGTDHAVKIATVVNFPAGDMEVADVAAEAREAIADGADEIDLVIPYQALLAGNEQAVTDMVAAVKAECTGPVIMKTILETGELKDVALIQRASELAIEAGSDFIKTSTGKVTVNATLEAADIMLRAIRDSGRKVGFKPAGGIGSVADAALYLSLAETIMAPDWAMPSTFRFGASSLLDDILGVLAGGQSKTASSGY
ncbi:deoxyribose-phosphate aldolase [Agrobacterium sp. SHOUNA12C]|uniref:Deoxyribose-phosphate aldolase n=1 Tax=Rhizobium rhizogenes NBRC 13257 TaxID=1220581 RepID=A0AA87Q903_RHIRH|nr:deoxyribose-phosphate aldolase [Rhizobium rhizogenes]KAA6487183.1 deoxyribose-phosphate aldolase [Agrobacterium sp. ICMP 7243]MCJ9725169.1 deoxyribose-phosphate aldolase [Agrobacterium sp. BETTINA12B]MCJ9760253.1 deoxyribose-phosphate aldolase [Agrobacterium sp. SHOUNA12C]MQB34352.1 deoxyribose-phosphate aldolase [Rhizobium rhizogenes]NTF46878.1 deoxyribose-phosphate aldolase [Rhizobium rhizogenes]